VHQQRELPARREDDLLAAAVNTIDREAGKRRKRRREALQRVDAWGAGGGDLCSRQGLVQPANGDLDLGQFRHKPRVRCGRGTPSTPDQPSRWPRANVARRGPGQ